MLELKNLKRNTKIAKVKTSGVLNKNAIDIKEKGITLIALVITIIVLLILARSEY